MTMLLRMTGELLVLEDDRFRTWLGHLPRITGFFISVMEATQIPPPPPREGKAYNSLAASSAAVQTSSSRPVLRFSSPRFTFMFWMAGLKWDSAMSANTLWILSNEKELFKTELMKNLLYFY